MPNNHRRFTKRGIPRWPRKPEDYQYIQKRRAQNLRNSSNNENENRFFQGLVESNIKWHRQYPYGYRLFDFYNIEYGVAIELDGEEHFTNCNKRDDEIRDLYAFYRSAIIVIRFKNKEEVDFGVLGCLVRGLGPHLERRKKVTLIAADYGLSYNQDLFLFQAQKPAMGQKSTKCKSCRVKFLKKRGQRYCTVICKANYLRSQKMQRPSTAGIF